MTLKCDYYMLCRHAYVESFEIDISEGDYGCKYVDHSEASCKGNSGIDSNWFIYRGIKCDSLYTYPDSSGNYVEKDASSPNDFDLPSVPFTNTECNMRSNQCKKCSPGYRLTDGVCLECSPGYECVNGLSQTSCQIGTFSASTGASICVACGTGRYAPVRFLSLSMISSHCDSFVTPHTHTHIHTYIHTINRKIKPQNAWRALLGTNQMQIDRVVRSVRHLRRH